MSFDQITKKAIEDYMLKELPHSKYDHHLFSYISNEALRNRLIEEYGNIRYVYKFFKGMKVDGVKLKAQIRIQLVIYASIQEAIIHHILFEEYKEHPEVKELKKGKHQNKIYINNDLFKKIEMNHKEQKIEIIEIKEKERTERSIKFEDKAETAEKIGLIDNRLKNKICEIYSMRNAIHLHAEMKKDIEYNLDLGIKAYKPIKGLMLSIKKKMKADNKL